MPGFLTPENAPNDQWFVRRIVLPADPEWCAVFDGHLLDLTYRSNWQQQGALTPEYMANWFWDHYAEFTENHSDAPEYNDANDVDGEPVAPWYEQLEDWIIAGFLAITFTPHAAIVYQATVPKLRIAIRTGNIGALFRVLINGVEVWTGDSYAPLTDFIEREFDTSGLATPFTVRVEHNGVGPNVPTGRAKLEYVRGDALAQMVATILRADPSGCGIQWSQDNGGTWNTVDLATCITALSNDAINQAIADGKIAVPGGQPGPGPSPTPGVCKSYHVSLAGNQQWRLPVPLNYGDTIQVLNVRGGWSDNGVAWWCPDGEVYLLDTCTTTGQRHDSGDPLNPGAWHMALVMNVDGTFYPAPTTAFMYTSGTTPVDAVFQANDGTLSDNTGSIEFDVEICTGWQHTFDFRSSFAGWTPQANGPDFWGISGVDGLHPACLVNSGDGITYQQFYLTIPLASTRIIKAELPGAYYEHGSGSNLTYGMHNGVTWAFQDYTPFPTGTDTIPVRTFDLTFSTIYWIINVARGACDGNVIVPTLVLTGYGVDPF